MRLACIDIGNTHTHCGLWDGSSFSQTTDIKTFNWFETPSQLGAVLQTMQATDIAYCSVVPNVCEQLDKLAHTLNIASYHLTCEDAPGLAIHYPKPQEIGQDRLANAICAQAYYGSPSIVIDMGTAVTFDIVGTGGAYEGGIIAPGIAAMTHYLHEQTALLPKLSPNDWLVTDAIGKTTQDAMKIGCVVGFSGMIRALLDGVLKELDNTQTPPIIGTGGTATVLLKDVHPNIQIDQQITLRGLAEAWQRKQNGV